MPGSPYHTALDAFTDSTDNSVSVGQQDVALSASAISPANPSLTIAKSLTNGNDAVVDTAGETQDDPVTDSDTSSYIGRGDYGLIAPTSTTVGQYIDGTAMSFEDYYAAQGGVIEYSVRNGQIHQTNPGVFFYYTGLSNTIVGVDGADAGTSADPMTVVIDQSDDSGLVGPFKMTKNDVKLFKVNDLDGNGIDAGDTYTQVRLNNSQITLEQGPIPAT